MMWFGDEQGILGHAGRIVLLAMSSGTCLTVALAWATRSGARLRSAAAVIAVLCGLSVYLDAPEFVFLGLAQLAALLLMRGLLERWEQRPFFARGWLELAIVAVAAGVYALTAEPVSAWRWIALGVALGVGAGIIDFGMTREGWGLGGIVACFVAVGLVGGTAMGLTRLDDLFRPMGEADVSPPDLTPKILVYTLLLFGGWRYALRLLAGGRRAEVERQVAGNRRRPIGPVRLVLVGPLVAALAVLIVTPTLEALWRVQQLPPRAWQPPAEPPDTYGPLVALAGEVQWGADGVPNGDEYLSVDYDRETADAEFFLANEELLSRLEPLLSDSIEPPIDYRRGAKSITVEHETAFLTLIRAVWILHRDAVRVDDEPRQFQCIRLMLLLKQRALAGGLVDHAQLGDAVELSALSMAYDSRGELTAEHVREIIELVANSGAGEEPRSVVAERHKRWGQQTDSWRRSVFDAVCSQSSFGDAFEKYMINIVPKEQATLRATLIAELAVDQYARQHEGRPPASVAELVPDYLAEVPLDPFSGQPLLICTDTGSEEVAYFVYSVGDGNKDDRGAAHDDLSLFHDRAVW